MVHPLLVARVQHEHLQRPTNGACRATSRSSGISTATARRISQSIAPSTGQWFIRYSSQGYSAAPTRLYQWGSAGDVPLAADFDGDGKTDLAVYRPSTGQWFIRYSAQNYSTETFGLYQWGAGSDSPAS